MRPRGWFGPETKAPVITGDAIRANRKSEVRTHRDAIERLKDEEFSLQKSIKNLSEKIKSKFHDAEMETRDRGQRSKDKENDLASKIRKVDLEQIGLDDKMALYDKLLDGVNRRSENNKAERKVSMEIIRLEREDIDRREKILIKDRNASTVDIVNIVARENRVIRDRMKVDDEIHKQVIKTQELDRQIKSYKGMKADIQADRDDARQDREDAKKIKVGAEVLMAEAATQKSAADKNMSEAEDVETSNKIVTSDIKKASDALKDRKKDAEDIESANKAERIRLDKKIDVIRRGREPK